MLACIGYAIYSNEAGEYTAVYPGSFALFIVKYPCAIALHLAVYPQFGKGLAIMKFANNQVDLFDHNGSEIAYCIGLTQTVLAAAAEVVNVFLLSY